MTQDKISLTLAPREVMGKQVRQLRRSGVIPAVIHDHGKDSVVVQAEYNELLKVYRQAGKHHPVNLKAGDKSYLAIIKSATFEPRNNRLNHVVFNAVNADEKVEAEIPIRAKYDEGNDVSPAERNSLIVLTNLDTVLVEAIPSNLPDAIEYNGEVLVGIGDHVTVADLIVPVGVEIKTELEHAVATVYEPSAIAAANDEAGGDAEATVEAVESEEGSEATPAGNDQSDTKDSGDQPKAD